MKASNFVAKYSSANKSNAVVAYDKIKATEKWVEYALDIVDMTELLTSADFDTKWKIADALEVAERKKTYMYRHKNFDVTRAGRLLNLVKHLPKTK